MDRKFWLEVRRALLIMVNAIEKILGIKPTTKDCRDKVKDH